MQIRTRSFIPCSCWPFSYLCPLSPSLSRRWRPWLRDDSRLPHWSSAKHSPDHGAHPGRTEPIFIVLKFVKSLCEVFLHAVLDDMAQIVIHFCWIYKGKQEFGLCFSSVVRSILVLCTEVYIVLDEICGAVKYSHQSCLSVWLFDPVQQQRTTSLFRKTVVSFMRICR